MEIQHFGFLRAIPPLVRVEMALNSLPSHLANKSWRRISAVWGTFPLKRRLKKKQNLTALLSDNRYILGCVCLF